MIRVCLNCYANHTTDSVYQWDQNHELELTGLEIGGISAVHFCNKKSENAIVVTPNRVGDALIVPIPNILLEEEHNIIAYVHVKEGESAKTVEIINIPLITRPKPDDYQFTENVDVMNFERLEKDIVDFIATISADNEKFKTDFMAEYNRKVDSGFFASPSAVERLNRDIEQLEVNDTSHLLHFDAIDNEIVRIENGTTGENLIPYPYFHTTRTNEGITFTDLGDGTVRASGTASTYATFYCRSRTETITPLILPPGTYTLNGCPTGGKGNYYLQVGKTNANGAWEKIVSDTGGGATFTLTETTQIHIEITIASGATVSNIIFKPMLEIGEIAHEYQPYVKSRKGIIDQIVADNLIPYPYATANKTLNGITWTVNNDGTITVNGTATAVSYFFLDITSSLPAGTYAISGCPSDGGSSKFFIRVRDYTDEANVKTICNDYGNGAIFTLTKDTPKRIYISVENGVTVNNVTFKPMLEKGPIAHAYRPYNLSSKGIVAQIIAENLIPYPYLESNHNDNGINWVVLDDGTIKANGTATAQSMLLCRSRSEVETTLILPPGTYTVSGCPKNGSKTTYFLNVGNSVNNAFATICNDFGEGATFTLTETTQLQVQCVIVSGVSVSNIVFKPMLEVGDVAHSYTEYRKSHTKLREDLDETIEKVSGIEEELKLLDELYYDGEWGVIVPAGTYTDNDYNTGASVKVLEDIKYTRKGYSIHIRGKISLVKMGSASLFDYITLGKFNFLPPTNVSFLFALANKSGKASVGFSIRITTDGDVQLVPTVLGDSSTANGQSYAIMTDSFEFSYLIF